MVNPSSCHSYLQKWIFFNWSTITKKMIWKLLPWFGYGLRGKKKTNLFVKFEKQTSNVETLTPVKWHSSWKDITISWKITMLTNSLNTFQPWWSASCADYLFHSFQDMHWCHTNKCGGIQKSHEYSGTALQSTGLQYIFSFSYSKAEECRFFFSTRKNNLFLYQPYLFHPLPNTCYSNSPRLADLIERLHYVQVHEFHSLWNLIWRETPRFFNET